MLAVNRTPRSSTLKLSQLSSEVRACGMLSKFSLEAAGYTFSINNLLAPSLSRHNISFLALSTYSSRYTVSFIHIYRILRYARRFRGFKRDV